MFRSETGLARFSAFIMVVFWLFSVCLVTFLICLDLFFYEIMLRKVSFLFASLSLLSLRLFEREGQKLHTATPRSLEILHLARSQKPSKTSYVLYISRS